MSLGCIGEGYWVDHWTYNLDLIESYLSIFPGLAGMTCYLAGDITRSMKVLT